MINLPSSSFKSALSRFLKASDLPSMNEVISQHAQMLSERKEAKYFKTSCPTTLNIAQSILKNN